MWKERMFGSAFCFLLVSLFLGVHSCVLSEDASSNAPFEPSFVEDEDSPAFYPHSGHDVFFYKYPYLQAPTSNGMTVAWHTLEEISGRVRVWDEESNLVLTIDSVPEVVDVSWFTILPLPPVPGFVHSVRLTGLQPGARYHYQLEIGNRLLRPAEFRTAPLAGISFRLGLVGDNRTIDIDHQAVIDALAMNEPDVLLNTGDMMGGGMVLEYWDAFFAIESDLLSRVPLLPVYGNHEHTFGEAYYAGFFHVEKDFQRKRNYSLRYGDAHFLIIDSNLPFEMDGDQKDWILDQLDTAKDARYLFVVFHHPFFSFSKHVPRVLTREVFHPIFVEHQVTAVFNGHNHCYERFLVDGVSYIVTGGGGAPLYASDSHVVEAELPLRKKGLSVHHYSILDVRPEAIRMTVTAVPDGEIIDSLTFYPRAMSR